MTDNELKQQVMKTNQTIKESGGKISEDEFATNGEELATLGSVEIYETDNLDETVLGAAAIGIPDHTPPELVSGTENLTSWDESSEVSGRRTPKLGIDEGIVDAGRLVEAGIEEADRERRLAAGDDD